MILRLDMDDKTTKKDVEDFIIKVCPFSDKNQKLVRIFEKLQNDPLAFHIETLGNENKSTNSEEYFLIWRNYDHSALFAGTTFINHQEALAGINLANHEV